MFAELKLDRSNPPDYKDSSPREYCFFASVRKRWLPSKSFTITLFVGFSTSCNWESS